MGKLKLFYRDANLKKHELGLPENFIYIYTKINDAEVRLSCNNETEELEITSENQMIVKPMASNLISIDTSPF